LNKGPSSLRIADGEIAPDTLAKTVNAVLGTMRYNSPSPTGSFYSSVIVVHH